MSYLFSDRMFYNNAAIRNVIKVDAIVTVPNLNLSAIALCLHFVDRLFRSRRYRFVLHYRSATCMAM